MLLNKYRIGIDTSLSKFAIVVFDSSTNDIVDNILIRTGYNKNKTKYPFIFYCEKAQDKVNYVVDKAISFLSKYLENTESIAIEGLSFASIGNATRDLAGVYHAFLYTLYTLGFASIVESYPPTTLTKHAKSFLEDIPKDKKKITQNAASLFYKEFLDKFVCSATSVRSGREDYSDAIIAHMLNCDKNYGGFKKC